MDINFRSGLVRVTMKWMLVSMATLMMGLEPLAANAVLPNEGTAATPQRTLAELLGSKPMLIARANRPAKKKIKKPKLRKSGSNSTTSAAELEQFLNVHRAGMGAVRGCVTNRLPRACDQLVSSKTTLQKGCLQGKTEACSLFQTLSSQEAYQNTSDALLDSVR